MEQNLSNINIDSMTMEQLFSYLSELRESHAQLWEEMLKYKYIVEKSQPATQSTDQNINQLSERLHNLQLHCDRERALSLNRLNINCSLSLNLFNLQKINSQLLDEKNKIETVFKQNQEKIEQQAKELQELRSIKSELEQTKKVLSETQSKLDQLSQTNQKNQKNSQNSNITKSQRLEFLNLDPTYLSEQRELELETIQKNLSLVSFSEYEKQQKLESVLLTSKFLRIIHSGQTFKDWKTFLKQSKLKNPDQTLIEYFGKIQSEVKILVDALVIYKLEFSTLSINGTQTVYVDFYDSSNATKAEKDLSDCCDRFIKCVSETTNTQPTEDFIKFVRKSIKKASQASQSGEKIIDKHISWSVTLEPTSSPTLPIIFRLLFLNKQKSFVAKEHNLE